MGRKMTWNMHIWEDTGSSKARECIFFRLGDSSFVEGSL